PPLTSARLTKRLLSLDLLVAVVIAVGIALSLLLRQGGNGTAPTNAAAPVAAAAADKSIAVLPFANLSTDADQDYFADGLADELINKLSQVRDLQVTGRNSSFYFKGRTSTLSEIGTMLGVGHVLQGSVRKSGTHLRINAQLMNAKSGINEWSQNFDSELTDIFGVQDQIAKAVTVALSVTLGVGEFHRNGMTRNADAYDEYLKGIAATAVNGIPGATAAVEHLQRAVAIDPLFSLGWLKLRDAYFFSITNLPPEQTRDFRDLMVKALQQARMVTPDLPELLLADADEDIRLGNWLAAEKLFRQVMDGNETVSAVANAKYGEMLSEVGRSKDALPYLQRAVRLDPLSADLAANLTKNLLQLGRIDEAVAEADRGIALGDAGRSVFLRALKMLAAYSVDDRVKAAAEVRAGGAPPGPVFAEVADLLVAHKNAEVLSLIKRTIEGDVPPVALAALSLPAQLAGDPALAADLALKRVGTKVLTNPLLHIWLDITAPVRQSPQFKHAVIDSGLLDYWRTTSHWADKCNPVGENDFECH
ncbi:MAG TPA: tetratricopeptide repeat protein, partial [Candidatus Acidoferrum sp.]|nr:tetratricopeptide repeat protein [Candidatus Acidoferrum sp.]